MGGKANIFKTKQLIKGMLFAKRLGRININTKTTYMTAQNSLDNCIFVGNCTTGNID